MKKRGRNPAEKKELFKEEVCDILNSEFYGIKKGENFFFTDLRTLVNFHCFNIEELDYSEANIDIIERARRYYTSKTNFDLDYCMSSRNKYSFFIMDNLYQVLWNGYNKDVLNSGETIVSPNRAITSFFPDIAASHRGKRTIDWSRVDTYADNKYLREFLHNIATIGNYIPVPSSEQLLLSRDCYEKFDNLLKKIKDYYWDEKSQPIFNESIALWLQLFCVESNCNASWKKFVDDNYLKGSFVNNQYDVVTYDGTLSQLSQMIYDRSIEMITEYEKLISNEEYI